MPERRSTLARTAFAAPRSLVATDSLVVGGVIALLFGPTIKTLFGPNFEPAPKDDASVENAIMTRMVDSGQRHPVRGAAARLTPSLSP